MEYQVKRINGKEEIRSCTRFELTHAQWTKGRVPKTWGYMGYLRNQGLYVQMHCEEQNPKRNCGCQEGRTSTEKGKRICDDSAMEIFIGFSDESGKNSADSMYINFELNANGAMFATYGKGKANRSFLDDQTYGQIMPSAACMSDGWEISIFIPESLLKQLGEPEAGLYCNFYKISETPAIEHYGSFAKINSDTPDFHRPQDFAKAVFV